MYCFFGEDMQKIQANQNIEACLYIDLQHHQIKLGGSPHMSLLMKQSLSLCPIS